jgi:hypothetical protein
MASGQCARRVITEVKQHLRRFSGWVTKTLLYLAPLFFGKHVEPLVPSALAVVNTHQSHWVCLVGYSPFSLCVNHKKDLCISSGDINRLMINKVKNHHPPSPGRVVGDDWSYTVLSTICRPAVETSIGQL